MQGTKDAQIQSIKELERVERARKIRDRKPSMEEVLISGRPAGKTEDGRVLPAVPPSPVKTYAFRNLENPGRDGKPGVCLRCNFGPKLKVEVDDGQIVKLPECVADWINSLEVPRYTIEPVMDPQTGRPTGESRHVKLPVGNKRFSLTEYQPKKAQPALPDAEEAGETQSMKEPKDEDETL